MLYRNKISKKKSTSVGHFPSLQQVTNAAAERNEKTINGDIYPRWFLIKLETSEIYIHCTRRSKDYNLKLETLFNDAIPDTVLVLCSHC